MTNEIKFADTVILVDVAYVDRVAGDLSKHFGDVVGRKLPKADLPVLLECLSLDSGIPLGENAVQVLFIYDEESKKMDAFQPSDLEKELNNVAFKSQLGEFALYSFEPSDMASREELFLESLRVVVDAKEVKRVIIVPAEEEYGDKVPAILNKVDGKKNMSDFRLRVFSSVAKNLSFTKASQELFISQPAITKHIQELETMYQTRLFERMGNKILLTDAGRLLLEHCEKILEDYGRLEYEMNLLRNEHTGELRLGASTTIAQYVLPPLLARFIEKFPQVSLSLFSGNSSEVEKALQEHRIDLALVEGNTRQPNLKYTPFLQDELVAIVHTHSKWMDYDEITLDELKEVPLVLRERGSGTLDVLITALHKHNIKLSDLTIRMHLGSTESIKLFLENSECMGILSIRSINKELYSGKFKVLDIKDLVMFREFDFVQLQGQDTGLPALFMQFANHYKEKL